MRAFLFLLPLFYRFLDCSSCRPGALSMFNSYSPLIKVSALADQKPSFSTEFPVFRSVFTAFVRVSFPLCFRYKLSIKIRVIYLCVFKIALLEDIYLVPVRLQVDEEKTPQVTHKTRYYHGTVKSSVIFFVFYRNNTNCIIMAGVYLRDETVQLGTECNLWR